MNPLKYIVDVFNRWVVREAPKRDPKKTLVKFLGQAIRGRGSGGEFEEPDVDLEEISRAYHTDSYIRRAVDKHYMLMFKSGWEISSKNEKASEYVWTRLKLMSEATGTTFEQLLSRAAQDFVLFANCFIVKARMKKAIPGIKAQPYTGKQPVAGYFILPPTTVRIARDDNGKVLSYQQDVGTGTPIEFRPEDVIHIYYNKPSGRAYGVPFVYNVINDVLMLRQIEENVARMIHRHIFPLYVYKVGLDKPGFEATEEEIQEIRNQVQDMPLDGGIVVPERHSIEVVGAEGNSIDAADYLKYFRQRVFTGLGVSDSVMGISDTANRSTSDNQSADLNDTVKEFQRIFAEAIQKEIINELLFEGGFDPILNSDDEVKFEFFEIEFDAKIKKENHLVQLFMQNAITHDEMRSLMGLDPVPDESRLHYRMIGDYQAEQAAARMGQNKDQPANQYGRQGSPGKPKKESAVKENKNAVLTHSKEMVIFTSELQILFENKLLDLWNRLKDDVLWMMKDGKQFNQARGFSIELARQSMRSYVRRYLGDALLRGYYAANADFQKPPNALSVTSEIERVVKTGNEVVDRWINEIVEKLPSLYEEKNAEEIAKLFDSNTYRLRFFAQREVNRAYNYGAVLAAKSAGVESIDIVTTGDEEDCEQCKATGGTIELNKFSNEDLLRKIPPHHPHCRCSIQFNSPVEEV